MYIIQDHVGYVAGYDATFQIIQSTLDPHYAKPFATQAAAQAYIDRYADAGYGLTREHAKIVPHPAR